MPGNFAISRRFCKKIPNLGKQKSSDFKKSPISGIKSPDLKESPIGIFEDSQNPRSLSPEIFIKPKIKNPYPPKSHPKASSDNKLILFDDR